MEKQRNNKNKRFVIGLLIILFSVLSPLTAATSEDLFKNLEFQFQENQVFSTGNEIKYQLTIPRISPLNVQIKTPESTDDIIFKTFRRTGDGNDGTKIEIWFQFETTGEITPSPLEVKIGTRTIFIPFASVRIYDPFANRTPQIYIRFSSGRIISENTNESIMTSPVSEKIKFTVIVQNTKKIISTDYEIPKDSLFTKTGDSSFEWTPLKKGRFRVPQISVKVTNLDGKTVDLKTPVCYLTVGNAKNKILKDKTDKAFSDSFAELETDSSDEDNFLKKDNFQEKIIARKKLITKVLFITLAFILLAALVLWLMKIKSPVPYLILSVLLVITMILFTALSKKHLAVYTEGTVKSIPEDNSGKVIQIPENSEVKILKDVGGWYCIRNGNTTGWTKKENVRIY